MQFVRSIKRARLQAGIAPHKKIMGYTAKEDYRQAFENILRTG